MLKRLADDNTLRSPLTKVAIKIIGVVALRGPQQGGFRFKAWMVFDVHVVATGILQQEVLT